MQMPHLKDATPSWVRPPSPPPSICGQSTSAKHARKRWWMVYLYPDRLCSYCSERLTKPTRDHVVPSCRGGLGVIENLVPACEACNNLKDNATLLMFIWRWVR